MSKKDSIRVSLRSCATHCLVIDWSSESNRDSILPRYLRASHARVAPTPEISAANRIDSSAILRPLTLKAR